MHPPEWTVPTLPEGVGAPEPNVAEFVAALYAMVADGNICSIRWADEEKTKVEIVDAAELRTRVLPAFFAHANFASFTRQLNAYGFAKVSRPGSHVYAHPLFFADSDALAGIRRKAAPRRNRKKKAAAQPKADMARSLPPLAQAPAAVAAATAGPDSDAASDASDAASPAALVSSFARLECDVASALAGESKLALSLAAAQASAASAAAAVAVVRAEQARLGGQLDVLSAILGLPAPTPTPHTRRPLSPSAPLPRAKRHRPLASPSSTMLDRESEFADPAFWSHVFAAVSHAPQDRA